MTYRKRAFTALVAGALALPLLATPASAGHGGPQAGPPQDITAFCTNPIPENFVDVNATDVFALAIQCIATAEITAGGPEGRPANQYGPNLNVRRGQMASFIARMLDAAEARDRSQFGGTSQVQALPAYDNSNEFTDVPANDVHVANINRLADANVVRGGVAGRPASTYSPNDFVSRAQMASFINRAAAFAQGENPDNSGTSTGYTTTNNYFVDSGEIAVHQANINGLASEGIVVGVQPESAHRYAPRDNVTRAQMAGFISRTLSQLFDDDRIHSLLEVFTGNVTPAGRGDATVATDAAQATTTRSFEVQGLNPATTYRVTAVACENVERIANDLVVFDDDSPDDNNADTGTNAQVVVAGGTAGATPNTATARPNAQGTLTFTISSGQAECVVGAIYINGGAGQGLGQGGTRPQLEVDNSGRPVEFFGITGRTTFQGDTDAAPTITDAFVATDAGQASEADTGDLLSLTFSEAVVATDGAQATVTANEVDGDPVTFVIECRPEPSGGSTSVDNGDAITSAVCTSTNGGTTVLIELLEDPQGPGGENLDVDYPLTITGLTFTDANERGKQVSLASGDTVINVDATRTETDTDGDGVADADDPDDDGDGVPDEDEDA